MKNVQNKRKQKQRQKNNLSMNNVISGKMSFITEGETKILPYKVKLREAVTIRFALQEMLKLFLKGES